MKNGRVYNSGYCITGNNGAVDDVDCLVLQKILSRGNKNGFRVGVDCALRALYPIHRVYRQRRRAAPPQFEREINYFIYFSTMVAALLLARASWNLYKFTKIFSFKDLETSMREKTSQIKSRENKK